MKLVTITIEGKEYYQWVKLGLINTVGDIFTNWKDIQKEKHKLIEQLS